MVISSQITDKCINSVRIQILFSWRQSLYYSQEVKKDTNEGTKSYLLDQLPVSEIGQHTNVSRGEWLGNK